jgi:hypothetical protein
MNARASILFTLLALAIGACAQSVGGPQATLPANAVRFDDTWLVLEPYLGRDFIPILPPEHADGRPLAAALRVRRVDGGPLPAGLTLEEAVVTFGGVAWRSQPETLPTGDPAVLLGRSVGGPKWGPGVTADVEVTLVQGTQRRVTLRAPAVSIERTE